jgi:hypothetical protein
MAWSIISNLGDSSVAMHLFNPFFDNFAEAFRLMNFSNRYFFRFAQEVEASLRCLLKQPDTSSVAVHGSAAKSHDQRRLALSMAFGHHAVSRSVRDRLGKSPRVREPDVSTGGYLLLNGAEAHYCGTNVRCGQRMMLRERSAFTFTAWRSAFAIRLLDKPWENRALGADSGGPSVDCEALLS